MAGETGGLTFSIVASHGGLAGAITLRCCCRLTCPKPIPTMQDLVAADASDHVRGSVIAIWVGGVRIGQTIGPVGVTLALGFWSTGSVLVIAGMGLFGVTVIATVARTLVPRSKKEIGKPL